MTAITPETNGVRLSFLELFVQYDYVEIPLIQRDYAQGRLSAQGVRDRFLTSLLKALKEREPLSLDFVYGKVATDRFQPIDGQQRLTTLFLLHWFLACAAGESKDFRQRMQHATGGDDLRFRYSVRPSSHRFFVELVRYSSDNLATNLAEQIQDQAWFFKAWLYDPTIVGALKMIEAIQQKFTKESELRGFYHILAQPDPPITIDVLKLENFGLSDNIYIKMNARGKELTGFEKFKAWLIEKHEGFRWPEHVDESGQWKVLLDGSWLDLFWHFHQKSENPADPVSKAYFRTFVALAVNFHALRNDYRDEWLKADADDQEAQWETLFTEECLESVLTSLHALATCDAEKGVILSLRDRLQAGNVGPFSPVTLDAVFFDHSTKVVTLQMRLWLHAICVFHRSNLAAGTNVELHWFRVIRNLLKNSEREFRAENFAKAIQSIELLGREASNAGSVLIALSHDFSLDGLNTNQLKEEKKKAALIVHVELGKEWERVIKEVECHPVLQGQIELLLPDDDDFGTFNKRWEVFQQLLDKSGSRMGKEEYLLVRAVLAHCGTITLQGQHKIVLADQLSTWTDIMDRNCYPSQIRKGVISLTDHLCNETVESRESVMRKSLMRARSDEPWMQDIIRYGSVLLKSSETQKIQNYYGNGVFLFHKTNWNSNDILLGSTAAARNSLICKITEQPGSAWKIEPGSSRLEVCENQDQPSVFFKGHQIKLTRDVPRKGTITCLFDYGNIVISGVSPPEAPQRIGFDEDKLNQIIERYAANAPAVADLPKDAQGY
jgi:hypothetical protein